MIAAWMLYCSLCALGLSAAAALAERALLGGRSPVRFVWIGAVALSLLVPATAFRFARSDHTDFVAGVRHDVVRDPVASPTLEWPAQAVGPVRSSLPRRNWRATLARYDQPLAIAWVTLSLAVAFNFFGGVVVLAWMRRKWQKRTVLGVPVFVAERTGPAVVGAVSPAIVVPEWVLAMEPRQLSLMLRHEQEHQRAGDGRLLTAVEFALIAMPWNLALWWQVLRLRVAVELDCDARVLQHADAQLYGDLLLEVARPRRRPGFIGATAFAERPTQLERRIRVLSRHRVHTSRAARAVATCLGLAAVTVAWVAPHPPVPARAQGTPAPQPGVPPLESALRDETPGASDADDSGNQTSSNAEKRVPAGTTRVAPPAGTQAATSPGATRRALTAPRTAAASPRAAGTGDEQGVSPLVDSIFKRLFEGITLTPMQRTRARQLLAELERQQIAQDQSTASLRQANRERTQALQTQRDSALRALLTKDADRARLDARLAEPLGGGRGRSGGPPADQSIGARRGAGGGDTLSNRSRAADALGRRGGGGRQGRGELRGSLDSVMVSFTNVMTELTILRLFEGIQLTADQEAAARALITRTQEEARAQRPQPAPAILRLNPASGLVSMQAESAAALIALGSNDADRIRLQSRIVSVQR